MGDLNICEPGEENVWNQFFTRVDRIFINLPVAEVRDFLCYSLFFFENLGKRSIQRVGFPNIPFSIPYCSSFMTTTDSLLTPFVRWQTSKLS